MPKYYEQGCEFTGARMEDKGVGRPRVRCDYRAKWGKDSLERLEAALVGYETPEGDFVAGLADPGQDGAEWSDEAVEDLRRRLWRLANALNRAKRRSGVRPRPNTTGRHTLRLRPDPPQGIVGVDVGLGVEDAEGSAAPAVVAP
jgi:hypothetical protein